MTRPSEHDLARLARSIDAAAAPTPRELAAIEARAKVGVLASLKQLAGWPLTSAEQDALAAAPADGAAWMAHRRAEGLPTDPAYFARFKAELKAQLFALRDQHASAHTRDRRDGRPAQ